MWPRAGRADRSASYQSLVTTLQHSVRYTLAKNNQTPNYKELGPKADPASSSSCCCNACAKWMLQLDIANGWFEMST